MKFKILIKQSFRDFRSKIIIYLTFTVFLIIVLSMVVGLFSFSWNFSNEASNINSNKHINSSISTIQYRLQEDEGIGDTDDYLIVKETNSDDDLDLIKYTENLIKQSGLTTSISAKDLIAVSGVFAGKLFHLDSINHGTHPIIDKHIKVVNITRNDADPYQEYNTLIDAILNIPNYLETNLTLGQNANNLFLNYFQSKLLNKSGISLTSNSRGKFNWISPEKWMANYYKEAPLQIQKSQVYKTYIYDHLNLNAMNVKQKDLFEKGKFAFATPKTLVSQNHKIGDIALISPTEDEYLIMGTANNPSTFFQGVSDLKYFVTYQNSFGHDSLGNDNFGKSSFYSNRILVRVDSAKNNKSKAQSILENLATKYFSPSVNEPSKILPDTYNENNYPETKIIKVVETYNILVYIIALMMLFLLFVVFYFITQQIIILQRRTLFFLKAMGESNFVLTLLTTLAIITPIIISAVFAIFGGAFIQNMMFNAIKAELSIVSSFWNLNWFFWLALLASIIIMFISFFLINMIIIQSKKLTIQGIGVGKAPGKVVIKFKRTVLRKIPSKLNIGISFAFKNIYKNLISLVVLSICFSVIIFAFQFNKSVETSAATFAKWNEPYKSVYDNSELESFHFENQQLVENFQIIETNSVEDTDLKPISKNDIEIANLPNGFKHTYIEKSFTKFLLTIEGKEYIDQKMNEINQNRPNTISENDREKVHQMLDSLRTYNDLLIADFGYDDGFNILMGTMLKPKGVRSYLSMSTNYNFNGDNNVIKTIAVSNKDLNTKKHYQLNEISSNNSITDNIKNNSYKYAINVNVSQAFANYFYAKKGDEIELRIKQITNSNDVPLKILVKVNAIIKEQSLLREIYTTKEDLFNYVIKESEADENIETTEMYLKVLEILNQSSDYTFDNTVYSYDEVPFGLQNLTAPYYKNSENSSEDNRGNSIMDYVSPKAEDYYLEIKNSIIPFNYFAKKVLLKSAPLLGVMKNFIFICIVIAFAVSLILTALILLENKEIILLMKSMGYKTSEVNWYLITGYLLSAILSIVASALIAYYLLKVCSPLFYDSFNVSINFIWNVKIFLIAFGLAATFCLIVSSSVLYFTRLQKPKNAFATL
ncbi:hypothetical protein ESOMN_v1c01160 [Williamsoniiplasma somnilux]|uniref:ABC3 transporter permease C-terminal domain-containing protein n=1 Tax=Williamsoniiplasma somnilux TaxID=215578 RepID=A0A2K8P0H3_9MOLU|nr:ABC transporter permease [Williamsoniiplasma somnilux]ATZ18501.1 hypothetical protein ESOMN_v1c01160 [Williamsoniiplasma somnilux]